MFSIRGALARAYWEVGVRLFGSVDDDPEPEPPIVVPVPLDHPTRAIYCQMAMVVYPSDSEPARTYVARVLPSAYQEHEG